ncbi:HEAT repeat domain-containing protein [Spirulina subsalsa FACHB-351]|uniref:HEAT repeat domain-containing protein n=1 Tax=Spirulina subsalsa FACHB-351 TaxID=234711 RepID=A0ABT3L268_9CYAN|nr:HEAT repeat domain-containing protein [Spirulina subsalsa]MCW6035573.1 HEAT repeat domain-containing protein [Spirulina subsalsa FACHB-351]
MSNPEPKKQFLEDLATQYKFYGDTRTAFLGRFAPENADKANNQLRLTWQKDPVTPQQKIQDELKKIYPVLRENGCDIPETRRGRYPKGESPWELGYKWLWEVKFPEWQQGKTDIEKPTATLKRCILGLIEKPTATLKRCILGLKGNYQEAQQKLTEITQTLQTRLKDKTLSIAKVEKGSIILIVESSQTGYEQIKTLIGQEIAGFPVEYAIDEWQDICRRMLLDRKPLSSNTVLGQVYGDRNLIDDDLFVDLALVKPKRSHNEKHPQDIDSEKGSDFFTRQEETIEKRFAYQEFLDEVISKRTEKQMAIIGEPGAGKTTLLQKLAFWLLQKTDDLVVWVDLAELGSQPLGEYLEAQWLKEALGPSREGIKGDWKKKFEGGAVWLLLDGLDEMSQSDLQGLNFRGWVTDARIIVTCRLNLWQANPSQLQGFQTYLTQPFQDEQVQEFIRRWFSGEAESLWLQLQAAGQERIKDLCRNPLRLTLLCATWKVENALPDTMAELYAEFVEAIYRWKKKEFTVTKEEKKQLNTDLGALAKASLDAETGRFRLTHQFVCKYFEELDEDSLVLRLGWLNEVGVAAENRREKVYGFYHATFQEYFAALAVADWDYFLPKDHVDRPVEGKRYRIFEKQWKQVILLWLGREDVKPEEKEEFIRALVEFKDGVKDFYKYQAYFLAAATINEFKNFSLAAEIVRQVVRWGFGDFNIDKQKWQTFLDPIEEGAKTVLGETIRETAITALVEILRDAGADDYTRSQAAESLGEIDPGNPDAIADLLQVIRTPENEHTLCQAAYTLGEIDPGNAHAIAGLLQVIRTTEDELTRWDAAESLEEIGQGNPDAIDGFFEIIRTAQDESIRWVAAETLGEIGQGNPDVITGLLEIIRTTEDEWIRWKAAESLAKIDPGNPDAIAGFLQVIHTTEDSWAYLATETLGEIGQGNPDVIAGLLQAIRTTENESTRWRIAYSLGKIDPGNPDAITGLLQIICTTENESTRNVAAMSLMQIGQGNSDAITGLLEIIHNTEDEHTLSQAAESLGEIDPGNPDAITVLVKLITTTQNEKIRYQAAESLGKIDPGNPEGIAALKEILRDAGANNIIRHQAVLSLGEIAPGNEQVISALVAILRDAGVDLPTRRQAAQSLGKILTTRKHYAGFVSALKDCLSNEIYESNFDQFDECYTLIWNCAENLPYPDFYQAWHNTPTTPHPEIIDQTPHNSQTTPATPFTCESLKHLPIYCLNAKPLATETRESEIALTLSELIWDTTCPDEDPPEPTTPAQLRRALKQLQRRQLLPHRALLLTNCEHPTPELITFCEKFTDTLAIALLTHQPLEPPLKGFPPNQSNLLSAIKTWLEEL